MKILMFSTHSMKYIWYSPQKSKYPLYIKKQQQKTRNKVTDIEGYVQILKPVRCAPNDAHFLQL